MHSRARTWIAAGVKIVKIRNAFLKLLSSIAENTKQIGLFRDGELRDEVGIASVGGRLRFDERLRGLREPL